MDKSGYPVRSRINRFAGSAHRGLSVWVTRMLTGAFVRRLRSTLLILLYRFGTMKGPAAQPFWTSVILHIIVLALLLLAVLFEAFRPQPKQHIFQMVSPPEQTRVNTVVTSPSPQPVPELPVINPMPELPAPVPQALPQPSPSPNNATEPPPVINYEQFVREHGKPKPRKPTAPRVIQQIIHSNNIGPAT